MSFCLLTGFNHYVEIEELKKANKDIYENTPAVELPEE